MGCARAANRRSGIIRPGPEERVCNARKRERDRVRQQECRNRKRVAIELQKRAVEEEIKERQNSIRVGARVNQRHVRRDANAIIDVVYSTLNKSVDFHHQEAVLHAVWSDRIAAVVLPESRRLAAQLEAQKEIIAGLVQSLSEVKNARCKADLVTKHAILTAAVTSGASTSKRQKARLLGVHPRNVRAAIQRRSSIESTDQIVWTLSVRKVRKDATSESVKAAVIAWWVAETRASPNRKEVVKHWIAPGVREKHHCQYLLESQVWVFNSM